MKKTLTINLNSLVFNIDEDAYNRLQSYLSELRHHLEQTERDEVFQDIEARIAELFSERLTPYKNVITIEDVESVITTLGSPDSFGPRTDDNTEKPKGKRRLYRDSENGIIAGVASGIATSQNIDPVLVRIIFVALLCISFGTGLIVYLLLWLIVPEARTVAQKLEMRGIEPTLNNISDYSHDHPQSDQPVNDHSMAKTMLKVIGFLILLPIILVLAIVAVVLLICLFVVPFAAIPELAGIPELSSLVSSEGTINLILISILAVASAVIPLVLIIKLIIHAIRRTTSEINTRRLFITLIIWVVLVIATAVISVSYFNNHKQELHQLSEYLDGDDGYYAGETITEIRCDSLAFNSIDASKLDIVLIPDTLNRVEVTAPSSALRKVVTSVHDSTLTLDFDGRNPKNVTLYVHYSGNLNNLDLSAAAELTGTLKGGKNLTIKASSAAEAELAELASEGTVTLELSSASEFQAERLTATTLTAAISSSSDLELNGISVTNLEITASSASDAELSGEATNVTATASSGADIDLSALRSDNITYNNTFRHRHNSLK